MKSGMVSVVVPMYNEREFILQCVQSLINQDYKNTEIIIVDDCSTDDGFKLVKYAFKHADKVRFIQNEVNSGMSASRNAGIVASRGEFILQVDADAVYNDKYVERMVAPLIANKNVDMTVPEIYYPFCSDTMLGKFWTHRRITSRKLKIEGKRDICGAWCYRRKVFDTCGMYDVELKSGNDVDMFFRARDAGYNLVMVETYFVHNEQTKVVNFIKRMWNGAYNGYEFEKRWGRYPTGLSYFLLMSRNSFAILSILAMVLSLFNPWLLIVPILLYLTEGYGPILVDRLWRETFVCGVSDGDYLWATIQYPFILFMLARANGFARLYRELEEVSGDEYIPEFGV